MKLVIYLFLTCIVFSVIGAMFGNWAFGSSELDRFEKKGVSIYGKAIEKYPENHATIKYSYEIEGKQFFGFGNAGNGNAGFDEIRIGQKVIVFYDRESPEISMMGYPQSSFQANKFAIILSAIFFPIFPMGVVILVYFLSKQNLYKKT